MTQKVFISYSSKDTAVADAVCAALERAEIPCWIAPRDIKPGKPWAEAIIDALDHATIMVFLFSGNSNDSQQVLREVERAVAKKVIVIPFRIENIVPTKALEYFISSHHWLNAYSPSPMEHLEILVETVKEVFSGPMGAPVESGKDRSPASSLHLEHFALSCSKTEEHRDLVARAKKTLRQHGFFENSANEAAMVLDELITNAVQHGCKGLAEAKVDVTLEISDTFARIRVKDPGKGFPFQEILQRLKENQKGNVSPGLRSILGLAHRLEFTEGGACAEAVVLNRQEVVQEKLDLGDGTKVIGKVVVLKFKGYFDLVMGEELLSKVKSLIKKSLVRTILDLKEVEILNSQGIGKILESASLLEEKQGRIVFTNYSPLIEKTLKLTFGDEMSYETLEDAVESFES